MDANTEIINELKARADKYRELYENSPEMHVSVNPVSARIIDCNQTLLSKTGYSKEEIIDQPIFFMYDPACLPEVEKVFQAFITTGSVVNAELILKRKDGSTMPVLLNVVAIKDENGHIKHSNSSWRDLTDVRSILQKSNEAENSSIDESQLKIWELEKTVKELQKQLLNLRPVA